MRTFRIITLVCVGVLAVMLSQAKADEWNQKTIITFNEPVEIPGQVLPAGTYVFKLADTLGDRNVVEVFNKNETHCYGMFLAIPDERLQPTGKPIITFEERAAGAPEAVRAWFYPGDDYGHEFVYPKATAMELAKANKMPVASMPNELAANTTKPTKSMREPQIMSIKRARLKAVQPTGEETEIAEAFPLPPTKRAAAKLPKTASSLPLVGLIGLMSLAASGLLRYASGT